MKKAGIIVGITIVILALVIYWIATAVRSDREAGGIGDPPASFVSEGQQVVQTSGQPSSSTNNTGSNKNEEKVFMYFDDKSLGDPKDTKNEIMVVSKKKIVLMDAARGTREGKQLVYCVDLFGSDSEQISLYLNQTAYNSLDIGDKVRVKYLVYENNVGTKFPAVISAEKVE